jgi:hypothetical protein
MTAHVDTPRESDLPALIGPRAARSMGTDMVWGLQAQRKILALRKTTKSAFPRPGLGDIPLGKRWNYKHSCWRFNSCYARVQRVLVMMYSIAESLAFWTLSIIRNLNTRKRQRFENWICFRLQVRGRRHLLCWVLLDQWSTWGTHTHWGTRKHLTEPFWTLNQLWSSHSRRFLPELRCWHARNKLNHPIDRPEPH